MKFSKDPLIDKECRRLQKEGWHVWPGGKHLKMRSPKNQTITIPGSPSDCRSAQNFIHQIRRLERAST